MRRTLWIVAFWVGLLSMTGRGWAEEVAKPSESSNEQQTQTEQRLNDAWNKMSLREKASALRLHHALREMPEKDRKFIQERIERFLHMSPAEKKQLRENAERWRKMTPEQREQARQQFREKRRQFEEKWKQEHPGEPIPSFPFGRHKQAPSQEPAQPLPDVNPQTNNPKGEQS